MTSSLKFEGLPALTTDGGYILFPNSLISGSYMTVDSMSCNYGNFKILTNNAFSDHDTALCFSGDITTTADVDYSNVQTTIRSLWGTIDLSSVTGDIVIGEHGALIAGTGDQTTKIDISNAASFTCKDGAIIDTAGQDILLPANSTIDCEIDGNAIIPPEPHHHSSIAWQIILYSAMGALAVAGLAGLVFCGHRFYQAHQQGAAGGLLGAAAGEKQSLFGNDVTIDHAPSAPPLPESTAFDTV